MFDSVRCLSDECNSQWENVNTPRGYTEISIISFLMFHPSKCHILNMRLNKTQNGEASVHRNVPHDTERVQK